MISNKITSKRKTLTPRDDNKQLLVNQKDKTKINTLETFNEVDSVEIIENIYNYISNSHLINEVKQSSSANNTTTNDKHDSSNRIPELKEEYQSPELSKISSINKRYKLNFKNYIQELHNALIKECNYNLLDYDISLSTTLDFESMTSFTNQTLQAVKVQ